MSEEKIKGDVKEADENITIYIDDMPFNTTPEGKKQLDEFIKEHNKLNHMMVKKEKAMLSTPCDVFESPLRYYEMQVPEIVLAEIGISCSGLGEIKDKLQFIKENGRIYVEKAKE